MGRLKMLWRLSTERAIQRKNYTHTHMYVCMYACIHVCMCVSLSIFSDNLQNTEGHTEQVDRILSRAV